MYQQTLLQRMASYWILLVDGAGTWKLSSKPVVVSTRRCTTLCCKWPSQKFPTLRVNDVISCHFNKLNCKSDSKKHTISRPNKTKNNIVLGENNSKIGRNITFPKKVRPQMPVYQGPLSGAPRIPPGKLHCKKVLEDGRWAHELDLWGTNETIWKATKLRLFQKRIKSSGPQSKSQYRMIYLYIYI